MQKIHELESLILKHKALYYQGNPEISDLEYDKLEEDLEKLDPNNKALQLIGSAVKNNNKIKHDSKMLSLNKVYELEELEKWREDQEVISTFKIDGVSCSIIYENGQMSLGKTRGDGTYGEDITEKLKWIPSIPSSINEKEKVEIRGELYCTESDFIHLSDEMVSIGLDKPTNQRNIVAGLISRKDHLELCRYIEFQAFDLITEKKMKSELEKSKKLSSYGLRIPEVQVHKSEKTIRKVIDAAALFMSEGDYLIDGLVFSLNDINAQEELGATSHHPRYKMAFKYRGETKKTIIKDIIWQVSRNGILTPVAKVKTVELSGAKISSVTLHNYGMVKQYNLKKNDEIEIIRSGEVIPKFLNVTKESKNEFLIPQKCPECDTKIIIDDIRLRCTNKKCPAQVKESILNFISKIGIDDLSSKRIEEMLRVGLIEEIPDLYLLTIEKLLTLEKTKEKLATKLYEQIQSSKEVDLITFLSALGIQGGAYNKCEKVVSHGFDTIEKILSLKVDDVIEVEGFAEKSANDFVTSLQEKHGLIKKLLKSGFDFSRAEVIEGALKNKKICITGALSEKRSVIEAKIRENGGSVVGSVSKNTDYLLTNEENGTSSKYKKAQKLEINIINEKQLLEMIK